MSHIILVSSAPMPGCRIEGDRQGRSGHFFRNLRSFVCAVTATGLLALMPGRAAASQAQVQMEVPVTSYILKETGSQNVIMAKDVDRPVSPASLTKVLTCLMAIESGRLDDVVVIQKEATLVEPTKAGLLPGDRVLLRDLVKAAMVNSSNDAAFSIGIYLGGGNLSTFVAAMNVRARMLGMNNSHFTNPAGYDTGINAGNRSTARDLMLLTEHAVRYPEFNAIARLDRAVFRELSTGRVFSLKTHNRMLERYPYTVGIKTGFTNRAGKCLIARAVRDRKDLVMVMLDAKSDRWAIASNMFDRGFGLNGDERLTMPEPVLRDPAVRGEPSYRQVVLERERALEAIRQKLARQGDADAAAGIRAGSVTSRDRTKSVSSRRADARKTLKAKQHKLRDRRLALTSTKGTLKSKRLADARKARLSKHSAKEGASTSSRNVRRASKAGNRTALSQKKKSGEVTKAARQKQRRVAISLLEASSVLTLKS